MTSFGNKDTFLMTRSGGSIRVVNLVDNPTDFSNFGRCSRCVSLLFDFFSESTSVVSLQIQRSSERARGAVAAADEG